MNRKEQEHRERCQDREVAIAILRNRIPISGKVWYAPKEDSKTRCYTFFIPDYEEGGELMRLDRLIGNALYGEGAAGITYQDTPPRGFVIDSYQEPEAVVYALSQVLYPGESPLSVEKI